MSETQERNYRIMQKIKEIVGMKKEMRADIVALINHKDQFDYLDGCIKSLKDKIKEIYLGDMSQDKEKLKELVSKYSKDIPINIIDIPSNIKSFALMRNLVLEKIPIGEWILQIDADERLEGDIFPLSDIYSGYRIMVESPHIQNNGRIVYERNLIFRIFKKKNASIRYKNRIHEQIIQNFPDNDLGYITSARIIHLGYDISVKEMEEKVKRNITLLKEELANNKQEDGYLWFHLGEMYTFLKDYFAALMAYQKALELKLKNPEMSRRAELKIELIKKMFQTDEEKEG